MNRAIISAKKIPVPDGIWLICIDQAKVAQLAHERMRLVVLFQRIELPLIE
ncbi:hypothetical protein BURMUCF1_A0487 [Burkholderia multivorans ATCC BAA-247]|nr:hypothetical protein BURMUCF1_A0487 [Burkholderia multivorans ATCC BAA-247]